MHDFLIHFSNEDFRTWLDKIGVPTFVGTSKRVFPKKGMKPIQVLNNILNFIRSCGIGIRTEMNWIGWNQEGHLIFNQGEAVSADIVVFALGGASWKVTGSDGSWKSLFLKEGIEVVDFASANCAFQVEWPPEFIEKHQGTALKNIALKFDNQVQSGELVITRFGLEGNAIYPLSNMIQSKLLKGEEAPLRIDLKPMFSNEKIYKLLSETKENNISKSLKRELNLPKVSIDLLKNFVSKEDFLMPLRLTNLIKNLPVQIGSAAPIDEAISTLGGVSRLQLNSYLEIKSKTDHYCLGEMIDWYAPTGGYLLQGCFSQGVYLARMLNS